MSEPVLRILVVDDEEPARVLLRELLARMEGVETVGECGDGFAAVKLVGELRPDVLLLDVQMPKLDGFEVLELLEGNAAVIFVTAYDEYALRAFEVNAVDYLLKPVDAERLREAVERARSRVGTSPAVGADVAAAVRASTGGMNRVVIRDGSQIHVVPVEQIDFVEAQGDYVAVHSGSSSHLKQQTLQSMEKALGSTRFVRIHRSYLLALDRLDRIEPMGRDSRVAVLVDGRELPVSRSGYARLKDLLG